MRQFARFLVWGLLIIAGILLVLRLVAVRTLRIPEDDITLSTSVIPSLRGGDLVVLWRLTKPKFGDLVVCPDPNNPELFTIGRVVGEPGDEVQITNGRFLVNGKGFASEYSCDPSVVTYPHPDNESEEVAQQCQWITVANHIHMVANLSGKNPPRINQSYVVPEESYFLASDNRFFPYDSRDYGFVDMASCKEMVALRLVSKDGWMDSENRMSYIH